MPPFDPIQGQNKASVEVLSALLVGNAELSRLEDLLGQFNVFEAAGLIRDERKHSRFLAFLLDPTRPHGFGDAFARVFLQMAVGGQESSPVTPIELELADLADLEVHCEAGSIDLLLRSKTNSLVVIIENKVDSGEHSGQLGRYYSQIESQYPESKILPLFLTPEGSSPSDELYLPVTYESIALIAEKFKDARSSTLGSEVRLVIEHYAQMLRRHIVSDSEIRRLCEEIYRKHRTALDLIYQYRQDHLSVIRKLLREAVDSSAQMVIDANKASIPFIPESWDDWVPRSSEAAWSPLGRMMLFWFEINEKRVILWLEIGPGPRHIAQRLLDAARCNKPPFNAQSKTVGEKFNRIYSREMISRKSLTERRVEVFEEEIVSNWSKFMVEMSTLEAILRASISNTEGSP